MVRYMWSTAEWPGSRRERWNPAPRGSSCSALNCVVQARRRVHNARSGPHFSARPDSGREDVAVTAPQWAWQFLKNLREAYVFHRCTGERGLLPTLACAWRTASILMTVSPTAPARSPMGATLSLLARRVHAGRP